MANWKKDRNYRKFKNADGSIVVDGEPVKVSADIYKEYARSARQLEYIEHDLKRNRVLRDKNGKPVIGANGHPTILPELEVSLDKLIDEENWDFAADDRLEDVVLRNIEEDALHRCLNMLDANDRALIQALMFEHQTVRKYMKETGIPLMTIQNRKVRILRKIKKLLKY